MTAADETGFDALRARVTAWVEGPGEEFAERIEESGTVPPEVFDALRDEGFLGLAAPRELGGAGLSFAAYLELMEVFSRSHGSIRMLVHVINGTWRAIAPYVTDAQREAYVKPSVAGQSLIAFTLTEPGNGTGADISTVARRVGDEYLLTGTKHLITFGVNCDHWLLMARREGTTGHDGTLALMVPNTGLPGATVVDDSRTMGIHGTDHAILRFENTPVPVSARIGEEGQGLEIMLGGFLLPSRVSVAMSCVGLAERAQQLAVDYANTRTTFGKTLAARQAIQFLLADNYADIVAARQLVLAAGRAYDEGREDAGALSSAAKLIAVDMLTRVTDRALQVHGGVGYWKRSPIERVYRDARAPRFEEGTNEIQRLVLSRAVLAGTTRYDI